MYFDLKLLPETRIKNKTAFITSMNITFSFWILDVIKKSCIATYDQFTYLPFDSTDMKFSMFLSI